MNLKFEHESQKQFGVAQMHIPSTLGVTAIYYPDAMSNLTRHAQSNMKTFPRPLAVNSLVTQPERIGIGQ